ncbi:KGK domain-containing protein [Leptolyngbya sp. FACHB-711]|uniref:KGK domain-containing protein n=1 Tax=unclassified Leptolyngbya TaxID=2650499 RepID=UPI00168203E4|nr:KGK domain-containing protein [Leptolyngbya sp. FACHB-711]MBD1850590.1 KGK domain-containing protein [Cyanobacteria bacterium FACHB-502]MBD2025180.1 KGK domain-containing protein [Leptolyngbya sp. FACHB-711]
MEEFEVLSSDEVLHVRSGRILMRNPTFKASELLDALAQLISEQDSEWTEEQEDWFTDRGLSCEVLRVGNVGWQRGRVRIRFEFAPERPKLLRESPPLQTETYSRPEIFLPRSRDEGYPRNPSPNREDIYPRRNSPQNEDWDDRDDFENERGY